jgi:hypothetical protein
MKKYLKSSLAGVAAVTATCGLIVLIGMVGVRYYFPGLSAETLDLNATDRYIVVAHPRGSGWLLMAAIFAAGFYWQFRRDSKLNSRYRAADRPSV